MGRATDYKHTCSVVLYHPPKLCSRYDISSPASCLAAAFAHPPSDCQRIIPSPKQRQPKAILRGASDTDHN